MQIAAWRTALIARDAPDEISYSEFRSRYPLTAAQVPDAWLGARGVHLAPSKPDVMLAMLDRFGAGGAMTALPYAFDTNDMRFYNNGGFTFAEDFTRYCVAAFDRLHAEGARVPRMMSVGLHTRIIGRPARIGGLDALLDHALAREGVWFASRAEIARAWRAGLGMPDWTPRPCPPDFASGAAA